MKILLNPELLNSEQQEYVIEILMELKKIFPNLKCIWNDNFFIYLYTQQSSSIYDNNYSRWLYKNANEIFIKEEVLSTECYSEPMLEFTIDDIKNIFYCIVHKLIEKNVKFIPFLHISDYTTYEFKCHCHQNILVANIFKNYIEYLSINYKNIINEYWPNDIQNFKSNFWILISTISTQKNYEIKYIKDNIQFTSNYMNDFINLDISKREIYINKIAMRLSKDFCNSSSLKDEPIRRTNGAKRRFRLSDADRIHYSYINNNHNIILFEEFNIENHDRGL